MKVSATEATSQFGHYLDLAEQGEAIIIERTGKEVAAIVDYQEYQHLKRLDEILLIEKIKQAEQTGYLSDKVSEEILKKALERLADGIANQAE